MILDVLENLHCYLSLNKRFAKAFDFLMRPDLKELPEDRYKIDGERVYAIVDKGPGRNRKDAMLETHEKYIDIQLVLAGTDEMGWKPKASCVQPSGNYSQKKDLQFFLDEPDAWLTTLPRVFTIFFPDDAHMPRISSGQLHKVIAKVAVD